MVPEGLGGGLGRYEKDSISLKTAQETLQPQPISGSRLPDGYLKYLIEFTLQQCGLEKTQASVRDGHAGSSVWTAELSAAVSHQQAQKTHPGTAVGSYLLKGGLLELLHHQTSALPLLLLHADAVH